MKPEITRNTKERSPWSVHEARNYQKIQRNGHHETYMMTVSIKNTKKLPQRPVLPAYILKVLPFGGIRSLIRFLSLIFGSIPRTRFRIFER